MRRLRLIGLFVLVIGLSLLAAWYYEWSYNWDYMYNHSRFIFDQLGNLGVIFFSVGLLLIFWVRKPNKQNPSQIVP
jgi:uncharacterized protein YjeT (DUF2065 family)